MMEMPGRPIFVVPAKAGIKCLALDLRKSRRIPGLAGMMTKSQQDRGKP